MERSFAEVDDALREWRQGDVVLASLPFLHIADPARPLTPSALELSTADPQPSGELNSVAQTEPGWVVLTQTCDIVRKSQDRPFIEVAPLREVSEEIAAQCRQRPQFAQVPAIADRNLVADLDRVMTIEKSVLMSIPSGSRVQGCRTDRERSDFANAIVRKRQRFAFPNDFNHCVRKFADRVRQRHGKNTRDGSGMPTQEGSVLAALREIRVLCANWEAESEVGTTFLFVFETKAEIPDAAGEVLEELLERFKIKGRFVEPDMRIVGLDELPTSDWLASAPLDYDHLSSDDLED